MIDSHCHLLDPSFETDRKEVLSRAKQAGVQLILNISTSKSDWEAQINTGEASVAIRSSIGIHPHSANEFTFQTQEELLKRLPTAVAVGEIGLDYYYNFSDPETQRRIFKEQLRIAVDHAKPVIIHCRDAYPDLLDILTHPEFRDLTGIVHCFTGSKAHAQQLITFGFYLSFGGMLTFKNTSAIRDVFIDCPRERVLLETDSPYLTPVPFRGKRNEPAFVRLIYEKAAELWDISLEEVVQLNRRACSELFHLDISALNQG